MLQRTTPRRRALLPVEGVGHFCYTHKEHFQESYHLLHRRAWLCIWFFCLTDASLLDCLPRGSRGREFCLERTVPRRWRVYRRPFNLTPLPPKSWILHDLVAASESAPQTSTTAAAFSAMTRSLQLAMIVSLLCLHYLTAVTLSAISDRASLKSESMFNNQQCRHCQPSNIKHLSLHQQSMRVVNQTHTHTHATRTRRLSGTNRPHERREHVLYSGVGRCGGRVEKYINRMTRIIHFHCSRGRCRCSVTS